MRAITSKVFAALFLTSLCWLSPDKAMSQARDYTPDDAKTAAAIANPERGFYKQFETEFGKKFEPLNPAELEKLYTDGDGQGNKKISLILRLYYIGVFRQKPIPPDALELIATDLSTLRRVGMKAILRFAYTKGKDDAEPKQAVTHIKQLRKTFEQYEDVIAVVQTGFVGSWGEWYAAHSAYGPPFDAAKPLNKNRRQVISELLASVTKDRAIQLRSKFYKDKYGVTEAEPDFYRIGFHNDALGGPISFQGMTLPFVDCFTSPGDARCVELSRQTKAAPVGGEAGDSEYLTKEGSATEPHVNLVWAVAESEFARNHWSYLNPRRNQTGSKNPTVVEKTWAGHFDELNNRLGYRFVLLRSDFKQAVQQGEDLAVTVTLRNDGWAAPFNRRNLELVLRPQSCEDKYVCTEELLASNLAGDTDPRKWLPLDHQVAKLPNAKQPEYTFSGTFKNLPAGHYILTLRLNDPAVERVFRQNAAECKKDKAKCAYDLGTVGRFSIRMANKAEKGFRWEAGGLNQLGTIEVK